MREDLTDITDQLLKDESATSRAVDSLIKVKDRERGKTSEVELKTDLSDDEVKLHTVLDSLSNTLEMDAQTFSKRCILSDVINIKERKALSKDRKSRAEIVEVARQPDLNNMMMGMGGQDMAKQGFIRRMFTPRK